MIKGGFVKKEQTH